MSTNTKGRQQRIHPEPARPCPELPGLPLVGNLREVRREGVLGLLRRGWKERGDVFRTRIGPQRMVVVSHPDAFERMLSSHWRNFPKGRAFAPIRDFLGDSLVTLDGDAWRGRRRLMQPYFHRAGLSKLFGTMVEVIDRYLAELRKRYPNGGEVDIHHELVDLTLEIVCTALFGRGVMRNREVSHAVLSDSVAVMDARLRHPFPVWVPTPTNLRLKRTRRAVDDVVMGAIGRARAARQSGGLDPNLLSMLLDILDDDGHPLRDQDLCNEVVTLYVAGHETTALAMTWMFVLLDGQDSVLARLMAEGDAVLGGRLPTLEDLSSLTYTRSVFQETLRMRGPVAFLPRTAVEDDNLCGYRVNAGEMVMMFYWGLHHHPEYWPRPESFDPERFTPAAMAARDSWAYLPFSGGPRTCIGSNFALFEGQLITSMMFQRATWKLLSKEIVPTSAGTLRPSGEVRVRFHWR